MTQPNTANLDKWVRIHTTPSHSIEVPANYEEDIDETVASYWLPGEDDLIQFSSYRRLPEAPGEQTRAAERLTSKIERNKLTARQIELNLPYEDYAAALIVDEDHITWIYVFLTWPHLAIFVSITGSDEVLKDSHWTRRTLKNIQV